MNILPRRVRQSLIFTFLLAGICHPFLYWGLFSGDAKIHFVYARNLLRGYPLHFNLGLPNSGETSMGFMLFDTVVLDIFGPKISPIVVTVLCVLALYATAWGTYLVARELGAPRVHATVAAAAFLCMPGNAFSAMNGTENVFFAALCMFFILAMFREGVFDEQVRHPAGGELGLGLFAGFMFWIRPEAAPLVGIVVSLLVVHRLSGRRSGWDWRRLLLFCCAFGALVVAYVVIFRHYAGELPYGAGKSRRALAQMEECRRILGVWIDTKVGQRYCAYFSILLPAAGACLSALKSHSNSRSWKVLLLAGIFSAFAFAYFFNFLPAVHFARYSIFLWPMATALMAVGIDQWARSTPWRGRILLLTILAGGFLGVAAWETSLRLQMFRATEGRREGLSKLLVTDAERGVLSRKLAESLDVPADSHAVLGYQEVQVRYDFNDNFTILSLDGITDGRLARYSCGSWIDHDGYLIDARADFLMEFPNYNADKTRWSIGSLESLPVGAVTVRPGITYTKIAPKVVRVTRTIEAAQLRPSGICGLGSNR